MLREVVGVVHSTREKGNWYLFGVAVGERGLENMTRKANIAQHQGNTRHYICCLKTHPADGDVEKPP